MLRLVARKVRLAEARRRAELRQSALFREGQVSGAKNVRHKLELNTERGLAFRYTLRLTTVTLSQ